MFGLVIVELVRITLSRIRIPRLKNGEESFRAVEDRSLCRDHGLCRIDVIDWMYRTVALIILGLMTTQSILANCAIV
jgi:hypothetical protein